MTMRLKVFLSIFTIFTKQSKIRILVEPQDHRGNGYLEESAFKAMTIGKTVLNRVSVTAK